MVQNTNQLSIDLEPYIHQLNGEIGADLTALDMVGYAINRGDYPTKGLRLEYDFTHSIIPRPPDDFLLNRERHKCFKSVMGSLQDYMDKLLAAIRLSKEILRVPITSTVKDIENIIHPKFSKHLIDVSTDIKLNIPKKLDILLNKTDYPEIRASVQSFFDIRNSLEHHKGIAKSNRKLSYKRVGLASFDGTEIIIGTLADGIIMKTFTEEVNYNEGGEIVLTQKQLNGIVLSISMFISKSMEVETARNISKK